MSKKSGLGKALQNKLERKQRVAMGDKAPIFYQETEQNDAQIKKQKMKSVIEQNSLTQFLQTAEMSQQNFKANRDIKFREIREEIKNRKVIMIGNKAVMIEDDIDQSKLIGLQLPRRPNWREVSKQQLEQKETEAYLTWRRKLGELEQTQSDIKITPYERNVEVWKQLWRVTERADVMIQIVDGRDPLFFRSEDLVEYIHELNPDKKSLVLINKSDLVPEDVRIRWNKYFIEHKINHIFFSAKLADKELNEQGDNVSEVSEKTNETEVRSEEQIIELHFNKAEILSIGELKSLLDQYAKIFKKQKIEVGLVGYPNVGKSSVINALLGKKKVGVASMPGKTKHFQTLILSDKVTLCDCPGLVFPRISASHAYMVLNGLFPIDALKSYHEPMKILTQRVPKKVMEDNYFIHFKQNQIYDAENLMNKYSTLKGFITGNGIPNQAVAARNILKDYINGVIVYARNPPGLQGDEINEEQNNQKLEKKVEELPDMKKKEQNIEHDLDDEFFKQDRIVFAEQHEMISNLTEDDLLDIIEGKKLPGMKVTKEMRSNIKHAMKRGEKIEQIKKKYFGVVSSDPKKLVKV